MVVGSGSVYTLMMNFNGTKKLGLIIAVVGAFLITSGVGLYLSYLDIGARTQNQIQNYLSLWEDEFYQEQIQSSDKKLQNKIFQQITWLDNSVMSVSLNSQASCELQDVFPLRFGVLQMESLYVCYSAKARWIQALTAPLFLSVSFIAFVILSLLFGASLFYQWQLDRQKILLAAQQELVSLSKRVAHDIRSPMSVLNLISVRLKNQDPEVSELVGQVNTRIQAIASELLEDANKRILTASSEGNWIQEDQILGVLQELKIRFDLPIGYHNFSNAPKWLLPLPAQELLRILSNVLVNSCESLDKEEKLVGLSIKTAGSSLLFEIYDNGCGIEENKMAQLWTEGAKENRQSNKKSHGLGLPQAKEKIETAGGKIIVISQLGSGTTVSLQVPQSQ